MSQRFGPAFAGLGVTLLVAIALGLTVGEVELTPADVWEALVGRLQPGSASRNETVIWSLRVPRVLGGVVLGVGLGAGGATLQSFYRNPMADSYLLGVSSAAGLGAVIGVLVMSGNGSPIVVTAAAATVGAAFAFSTKRFVRSPLDPTRLVLIGITLGIAFLAWTVIVVFVADSPRLPTFTYFVFGSLGTASWATLWPAAAVVASGTGIMIARWRSLDLLALGESEAHHLGLDIPRISLVILGTVGAVTGATVALGGVVGFIGLLSPMLIGRLVGPSTRLRIPAAALSGAALVIGADVLARAIAGPVEVPIGIITAAIGGPLLAWLIIKERQ